MSVRAGACVTATLPYKRVQCVRDTVLPVTAHTLKRSTEHYAAIKKTVYKDFTTWTMSSVSRLQGSTRRK